MSAFDSFVCMSVMTLFFKSTSLTLMHVQVLLGDVENRTRTERPGLRGRSTRSAKRCDARSREVKQFDVATNKAESRREASISTFRETCRFRLSEKSDRGQGHTECFMSGFAAVSARRRRTVP